MDTLAETETEEERARACAALDECVRMLCDVALRARTAEEIAHAEIGIAHIMSTPRRLRHGHAYVAFLSVQQAEALRMARARLALRAMTVKSRPRSKAN